MGVLLEAHALRREGYQARHKSRFRDNHRTARLVRGSLLGVGSFVCFLGWIPAYLIYNKFTKSKSFSKIEQKWKDNSWTPKGTEVVYNKSDKGWFFGSYEVKDKKTET